MSILIALSYAMLCLGIIFSFIRLLLGPSLPDRVVALELIASLTVGMIATYAVDTNVGAALDVALVLALTGFLAALAFARYLEKRGEE
ncbi:monovalent cation/H+ antiporter complex subunit F [Algiphilus sp.]|uniref:monovalent cation/H+ antiporter complex subunit F n=1 Tax=Algiphilus sp. TaxID=1872431 RepID=UPI001CA6A811|nr:monovalent cation/H+ antiporter complex subunit F [Algiphilus sp.]MBY8964556.1 cation:proton antiporter [Algiphilus acroporae]MCI5063275.1 monovalent cation/H+ antiporter complex subunit F [Algiphilus sp.]MCI5102336.1 monovalent cation/H+ antiporter complex subunit F [Algiphilus sp.]